MKNYVVTLHGGPKRTASTWLQYLMTQLINKDYQDGAAWLGNSENLAIYISKHDNKSTENISSALIDEGLLRAPLVHELQRLRDRIKSNSRVSLSCELFAGISPSAFNHVLGLSGCVNKKIIFVHRPSEELLLSLFANGVVGGYQGVADDFMDDVLCKRIHSEDLYPNYEDWRNFGWDVEVFEFRKGHISEMTLQILNQLGDGNLTIDDLREYSNSSVEVHNRSLTLENLFRISLFTNAIISHPQNLTDKNQVFKFINRILVPWFRDTPYTEKDFDLRASHRWSDFLATIDRARSENLSTLSANGVVILR